MLCPKCRAPVSDAARFCPECGCKIDQASIKSTIQLRCKHCDGIMEVDPDRPIIYCQYCGSKELLNESDTVVVQRIKSKTHKEIEVEKLKFEKEKYDREESLKRRQESDAQKRELKQSQQSFRNGTIKKVIVVCLIVSLFFMILAISNDNALMIVVTAIQAIMFIIAWLKGMQFIRERHPNSRLIFLIIGLVLIVPFLYSLNHDSISLPNNKKTSIILSSKKTFEWPSSGICAVLPAPKTDLGELKIYSSSLILELHQMSIQDYNDYIDACIDKGFTIDVEQSNTEFEAYNSEGYKLHVWYYSYSETINVDLDNPLEASVLTWPDTHVFMLLPPLPSSTGVIYNKSEDYFNGRLTGVSKEIYDEYVASCEEAGFNLNQDRSNSIYEAENSDGYKIRTEYQGFEIMYISIHAPDQK